MLRSNSIARIGIGVIAAWLAAMPQPHAAQPDKEIPRPTNRTDPAAVATALWDGCLGQGRQVVLSPGTWTCTETSDGEKLLGDLTPDKFDPDQVCKPDNTKKDLRIMPTGVLHRIKEILDENLKSPTEYTRTIQKIGIRIIGGVYCKDEVNLSDFTLAAPLDLDRSVLKFGFRARNMNIGGNLSFAGSYIYENFDISNAKIGGTLFGRGAFIYQVRITDTEVRDSLRFNDSILLGYFVLAHVTPGRLIDVSRSKISSLSIRQSPIAERLELSNSEAACKYQIENSELNEVRAINAGFGTTALPPPDKAASTVYRTWARPFSPSERPGVFPQKILDVKTVKTLYSKPNECDDSVAKFGISGGSARSICLQNFYWIEPKPNVPAAPTSISFNNVNISGSMAVDLWSANRTDTDLAEKNFKNRTLEVVGTAIGTLFFDFSDNRRPYVTLIDQISINRVHAAEVDCTDYPNVTRWPTPDPAQVAQWLHKNQATSLQPYVAFIKAFENAGTDTTDLKVAKADFEFNSDLGAKWREFVTILQSGSVGRVANYTFSLQRPIDLIRFSINKIAGVIADFGYRPYKSLIYIAIFVLIFYHVITSRLGVTQAKSELRPQMLPVNIYFVIDWMIPGYNLDPAHAKISSYHFANGQEVDEATERLLNRILLAVRITGVIAAVFLTATLKAFVIG